MKYTFLAADSQCIPMRQRKKQRNKRKKHRLLTVHARCILNKPSTKRSRDYSIELNYSQYLPFVYYITSDLNLEVSLSHPEGGPRHH